MTKQQNNKPNPTPFFENDTHFHSCAKNNRKHNIEKKKMFKWKKKREGGARSKSYSLGFHPKIH
jgi:hypothetical protein